MVCRQASYHIYVSSMTDNMWGHFKHMIASTSTSVEVNLFIILKIVDI